MDEYFGVSIYSWKIIWGFIMTYYAMHRLSTFIDKQQAQIDQLKEKIYYLEHPEKKPY
ncbi:hypothetical protein UNDYM_3587 [Undibacterium sp. YM2]|uniref:hypothetical protein n=1 Tax=Undibacterium sp. YM2 TaxID=2058625 RepID=UPI001331D6DF|nr:hypothetical protein [Undibacterium sp. YM2]BBB67840.1 hypothetical protein UNDYM_3587 [Undibacterium sp. YM2]